MHLAVMLTYYLKFYIQLYLFQYCLAACDSGWFGEKCQFLCHCETSMQCDANGNCPTKCDLGWFGLQCQYQDLASLPEVTVSTTPSQTDISWLNDGNDATCNVDQSIQSVKLSWSGKVFPFSWLRLKINNPSVNTQFNLSFLNDKVHSLDCNPLISILDISTVDYVCDIDDTIQIIIYGAGVKSLCSLYVSGGRNVALRQSAVQSSTFDNNTANLAVDGNTDPAFLNHTCTHTGVSKPDTNPSWNLTFDSSRSVQRFVLYNRAEVTVYARLKHFKLEALDVTKNIVWSYQDTNCEQFVYSVTSKRKITLHSIRIFPTFQISWDRHLILTLCEVQVYGDCVYGTWGLDCNKTCPQDCNALCHQETGQCLSRIENTTSPVYETVQACEDGLYGYKCCLNCSSLCTERKCDPVNGHCFSCLPGFLGPYCDKFCPNKYWGKNCTSPCNNHCLSGMCDAQSGNCNAGCEVGYELPDCLQTYENDIKYENFWQKYFGIGFAVGLISMLAVQTVVFVIILLRRRRSNQKKSKAPKVYNQPVISIVNHHEYEATYRLENKDDKQYA